MYLPAVRLPITAPGALPRLMPDETCAALPWLLSQPISVKTLTILLSLLLSAPRTWSRGNKRTEYPKDVNYEYPTACEFKRPPCSRCGRRSRHSRRHRRQPDTT